MKRLIGICELMILLMLLSGCRNTQTVPESERSAALSAEKSVQAEAQSESIKTQEGTSDKEDEAMTSNAESTGSEAAAADLGGGSDEIVKLEFKDMYSGSSSSRGLVFSEEFSSMDGKTVQISGYMAPPLKPVFNFFVLSKEPMSICPFCSTDADWPEDIMVVYVEEGAKSVANDTLLTVTGRLELGSYTDEETGFVSQARIYADRIEHNR